MTKPKTIEAAARKAANMHAVSMTQAGLSPMSDTFAAGLEHAHDGALAMMLMTDMESDGDGDAGRVHEMTAAFSRGWKAGLLSFWQAKIDAAQGRA